MRTRFIVALAVVVVGTIAVAGLAGAWLNPEGIGIGAGTVLRRQGQASVVSVDPREAAMNRAIEQARESLDSFLELVKQPGPGQRDFEVKVRYSVPDHDEHLWLHSLAWEGERLWGTLGNQPVYVKQLHEGQRVEIDVNRITDWTYYEFGRRVGGFTMQELADDVGPEEAAEYDYPGGRPGQGAAAGVGGADPE